MQIRHEYQRRLKGATWERLPCAKISADLISDDAYRRVVSSSSPQQHSIHCKMDDRRAQRKDELRRRLADAPEGTLALLYELMDAAHSDFGTTTRSLFKQLCDEGGIAFEHSEAGSTSQSRPPSPIELPPSPSPGQVRAMDKAADDHYDFNLKRSVLYLWRDKAVNVRDMEVYADSYYARGLRSRAFNILRHATYKKEQHQELQRRLRIFVQWRDKRLVERCLRSWILRHRENSLNKFQNQLAAHTVIQTWQHKTAQVQQQEMRAEDARDYMAASSALSAWRSKAAKLRGLRKFKMLYLRIKYLQIWLAKARQSSRTRYDEMLKDRYRQAKQRLGMRSARRALDVWREKLAGIQQQERIADNRFTQAQESNIRKTAHGALTNMYTTTTHNLANERIADSQYESQLLQRLQLLDATGPWRTQVAQIRQQEARADEYREIKTQEVARDALRSMRNQSSRTRQMEAQAEELYDRHTKQRMKGHLAVWREKAGEKMGVVVEQRTWDVAPATPAARRDRLLRGVMQ
jgi:hypothetical protein